MSAGGGAGAISIPPGATGIQLCRYFRRGTKTVNAPNRLVASQTAIASLTDALNRLRPGRGTSDRCESSKHGWIDVYFVYEDSVTRAEVLLGGCGVALGPKGTESLTTPRLVGRLVSLTSR